MSSETDYTNTYNRDIHKPSALEKYRLHFFNENQKYAYVNINPELIGKLHWTSADSVIQEATDDGALVIRKVSQT